MAAANETVNIRLPSATKQLIDRAADEVQENRSTFMLEASVARAETILADRTRFTLSKEDMRRFNEALDAPLPDAKALKKLLSKRSPWEK